MLRHSRRRPLLGNATAASTTIGRAEKTPKKRANQRRCLATQRCTPTLNTTFRECDKKSLNCIKVEKEKEVVGCSHVHNLGKWKNRQCLMQLISLYPDTGRAKKQFNGLQLEHKWNYHIPCEVVIFFSTRIIYIEKYNRCFHPWTRSATIM